MSDQHMNPDDGVEDEFRKWMQSIRAGRDRWRGRGSNQRRRRDNATQRTQSNTQQASRKESTARLIAALEAKRYALDIEREHDRQNQSNTTRLLSAEEIRRQAVAPDTEQSPAMRSSEVAQTHVDAHRENLIAMGVSAGVVDGMIGQYEQQLDQARSDALSAEGVANSAEKTADQAAEAPDTSATITDEGRHLAGRIDLKLVQDYTSEALDQVDELQSGHERSVGELISDSGVESGMAVNTTAADTNGTGYSMDTSALEEHVASQPVPDYSERRA